MANSTAADAAKHISAAFIAWQNTVGHREGAGTNVVSNHLQRGAIGIHVGCTGLFNSFAHCSQKIFEKVNIVVAVNVLQNSCNTLQTHTRVNRGLRQFMHYAVFITVKLHEH